MSYETAKYILWGLLCLPFIALCIYMLDNILEDVLKIKRENKAREKAEEDERMRLTASRRRRERFEEEYARRRGGYY